MKIDATRLSLNSGPNYSLVLMQQGRVQLDADWNEQAALQTGFVRRLGADLIGAHGGPVARFTANGVPQSGFAAVAMGGAVAAPDTPDFLLLSGNYYVGGVPCANGASSTIVTGYPGSNSNRIAVFNWTTDGIAFQTGQYVWLYSGAIGTTLKPVLLRITAVEYKSRSLTVTDGISGYMADVTDNVPNSHFLRRANTYLTQADYPQAPALPKKDAHLVYLDVWEREIVSAEDDAIREVALGGPDTTARAKVAAQVKILPDGTDLPTNVCPTPWALASLLQAASRGCLAARAKPVQASSDPCTIAPDALYRGPENQLYRVEIHTGAETDGTYTNATFKWSRENGAVVFPIAQIADPSFTLETLGRDDRFSLTEGDWVEVVDDDYVLMNMPAPLRQVTTIDRVRLTVTLSGKAGGGTGTDPAKHPLLRRWDQKQGDPAQQGLTLGPDNAALIFPELAARPGLRTTNDINGLVGLVLMGPTKSKWFELEDGVQVQFTLPPVAQAGGTGHFVSQQFRSSDYWTIPARVATANVEWPVETVSGNPPEPVALLPHGPVHHYAPLACISVASGAVTVVHDCLVTFTLNEGLLRFTQNGDDYTPDADQETETAPSQQAAIKPKTNKKLAAPKTPPPAAAPEETKT
ncbi:MAG TPA: DUF6519 domain-containing protein [Rhizomicrobium sp.]|jgi:hypothetical protein